MKKKKSNYLFRELQDLKYRPRTTKDKKRIVKQERQWEQHKDTCVYSNEDIED